MVIKSKMNFPIFLTYIRIIFAPIIVVMLLMSSEDHCRFFTMITFITISLTDFFDGYYARKLNLETEFGRFLDPVADKILVVSVLITILYINSHIYIFIPVLIIVLREILISSMREWSASSKNFPINVSFLGKLKTFIQLISISLLIYNGDIMHYNVFEIGIYGLYLAAIMSLISLFYYFKIFRN